MIANMKFQNQIRTGTLAFNRLNNTGEFNEFETFVKLQTQLKCTPCDIDDTKNNLICDIDDTKKQFNLVPNEQIQEFEKVIKRGSDDDMKNDSETSDGFTRSKP
eukprot:UN03377